MYNFAGGSTQVLHERLEIDRSYAVRIAKGADESCMLLIPSVKNNNAWIGYHAWLGGELGFTEYTVLHTCDRESFEKKLLEKRQKPKIATSPYIDLNSTTSSSNSSDEPLSHHGLRSAKREFQQAGRKCYSFPSSVTKRKVKHKLPSSKRPAQGLSSPAPAEKSASQPGFVPIRTPPRLNSPLAFPPTPSTLSTQHSVRFHFLVADESLGAIPLPLHHCLTLKAFFSKAYAAFRSVDKLPAILKMAGVKVVIKPSTERPIFVLWMDQETFHMMMDIVKEMAAGRRGRLDVEVTCVRKGT